MSRKPKVLVVDDRGENLLAVRAVLEGLDIQILEASSGEQALRQLLEHDVAVILLDVEMPGTDGFTTAQIIRNRQRTRHTPIIFLTAVDRGRTATNQGYALGAVDYIIKPFVPEVLRWKVSVFADLFTKASQTEELLREQAARREWEIAAKRSALLADVTSTLVCGNNYAAMLRKLPELVVPELADWACLLEREQVQKTLHGFVHGGGPAATCEVGPPFFERIGGRDQGRGAAMIISLFGRTGPVGALVVFRKAPARYTATDRLLGKEISDRASLAIVNGQLFEEAEAANRAKDQFLAVVSHELRTPLNAISGWVQILRTRQLDPNMTAKALRTIEQNAKLQDELISDILDLSRIVAGQLSVTFEDVDIQNIVDKTIDTLKPTADAKHVRLEAFVEPTAPMVAGDSKRLQQVLWNLVSNAIKFTPQDGLVQVRVDTRNSFVRITVQDTGPGIKPDFIDRVFDPFIQGDSSLKRSFGGLGLGLAITRHLVELHGGQVQAESDGEGKGSVFTVLLPLRRANQRAG